MPGANPLAGADVDVWERVKLPGASMAAGWTGSHVGYGALPVQGAPRAEQVSPFPYPGTATIRARSTQVDLGFERRPR